MNRFRELLEECSLSIKEYSEKTGTLEGTAKNYSSGFRKAPGVAIAWLEQYKVHQNGVYMYTIGDVLQREVYGSREKLIAQIANKFGKAPDSICFLPSDDMQKSYGEAFQGVCNLDMGDSIKLRFLLSGSTSLKWKKENNIMKISMPEPLL
ncbi:MAG: hypothetical protein LRY51_04080, partial [Geovibrio sp.]|nr:hypothetical protein [Geovibrio sp.]